MTAIIYKPDADTLASFDAWRTAPERAHLAKIIGKYSPFHCYKRVNDSGLQGHYAMFSYCNDGTVTVVHGWDSFFPRTKVFGVPPESLELCDCGAFDFEPPEASA